jgi:ribonuclease HI
MDIYCDGSCEPNPGTGGWGVAIPDTGQEFFGGEPETTNNRMEMRALIEALKVAPPARKCTIHTDSMYCVDGANTWRHAWERNGWKRGKKANSLPVKNPDLWKEIAALMKAKPLARIQWVKGHNGNPGNELADDLAGQGRWQIEIRG